MAELAAKLKESIAYFEQILTVLPEDRTALEFLHVACEQLGEHEKARAYLLTLADVVLREKDATEAAELIKKLQNVDDSRAKAKILQLEVLVAPPVSLQHEQPAVRDTCAKPSVAAKAEVDLLKRLVEDGVLHQALVQNAFDQLENLPHNSGDFLISALCILEKENMAGAADAVAAVADAAHAPPIPLESFAISPANVRRLPERLVKVRGVIPFAQIGEEWAVAVLNPLDETLRIEVTEALGARCHFFLAMPGTIERVLERVFRADTAEESAAGAVETDVPVADEPPPVARPALRSGFTLIEVLMASAMLVLFPAGALVTTLRLEKFARLQSEEMAAAAFCEDVYNRCLREETFSSKSWRDWSKASIKLPEIRLKGSSTWYSPLTRAGYQSPQYRIVKKSTHDVRVSMKWGAKLENIYHSD